VTSLGEMIATRDYVLQSLAWHERVATLGATGETREAAKLEVANLREQLHQIEEKRRVAKAAARASARTTVVRILAVLTSFAAGAVAHAQWPILSALVGRP
jgi:transcription elongation GreA/GreB family factor